MPATTLLEPIRNHRVALLTTYLPDGGTATREVVRIAVDNDRVLLATWDDSTKAERLRHHPLADIAPCTLRGRPTGPPLRVRARRLEGEESRRAGRLLARRFPFYQRLGAPLSYRTLRHRPLHYELRPLEEQDTEGAESPPDR